MLFVYYIYVLFAPSPKMLDTAKRWHWWHFCSSRKIRIFGVCHETRKASLRLKGLAQYTIVLAHGYEIIHGYGHGY